MKPLRLLSIPALFLGVACSTSGGIQPGVQRINRSKAVELGRTYTVAPSTLKILQQQAPRSLASRSIDLYAAIGEAESAQLVILSGKHALKDASYKATLLTGPDGYTITPETGVVGYIPVTRPSPVSFWKWASYPDAILPKAEFDIPAGHSQAIWYSAWVPRTAPPGIYKGVISIFEEERLLFEVPVQVKVYNVTLPVTSFLKTSINFRKENVRDPRYYGESWTKELEDQLPFLGLKYRFSHRVDLPLQEALGIDSDNLVPDWTNFDAQAEYWLAQGITAFELKLPIIWSTSPEEIDSSWGPRLKAINDHLVARNWTKLFYFYFYDEPFRRELKDMRHRLDTILKHAPDVPNILTMGITTRGQKILAGRIGIWVPNIHQYNKDFALKRQALGEQVWIYTCIGNVIRRFPDSFRIDWYGTAHRALGWWLYQNNIDGYLYWAVDLWRNNPWENAATFPWTNGDGMMFYPPLDGKSLMYPSTRVHMMRDAFEDYDLLTMLEQAYAGIHPIPDEARQLLEAKHIIPSRSGFSRNDYIYIESHRKLLELLEQVTIKSP